MTSKNVQTFKDDTFDREVLESDKPVLVDVWAEWCAPCRALAPIVQELADEYEGSVTVGKLDADANTLIPTRYGIQAIPALLLFQDGEVVQRFVGLVPKDQIAEALDRLAHEEVSNG